MDTFFLKRVSAITDTLGRREEVNGVNEAGSPNNPPEKQGRTEGKRRVFFLPIRIFRARNSVT
jgi:hypothetical protein